MATDPKDQSLIHREMARRAQDVHRVRNPRSEDYKLVWDSFVETIPAGGTYDLETYKMEKYLREMTALLIRERIQAEVDKENERRRSRGEKEMEKWTGEAQHVLEGKVSVELNSPESISKIYKELYVGLVKEYGVERVERVSHEAVPSTHEQIMGQLLGTAPRVVDANPPILQEEPTVPLQTAAKEPAQPEPTLEPQKEVIEPAIESKKEKLVEKISKTK